MSRAVRTIEELTDYLLDEADGLRRRENAATSSALSEPTKRSEVAPPPFTWSKLRPFQTE